MLPTSGYFRSVNCPFFESGLCERPHCHFRHVKKDPALTLRPRSTSAEDGLAVGLSSSSPDNAGKPDLLRLVSEAVLKMQREMEQGRHVQAKPSTPSANPKLLASKFPSGLSDSSGSLPVIPPLLGTSSPLATATTTTPVSNNKYLDSLNDDDPPVVPKVITGSAPSASQYMFVLPKHTKYRKIKSSTMSQLCTPVLEYKPTPIAELKKMKEQQHHENNKYGLTFKEQTVVDDLEYDPVLNYTAGYPNKKKKLITPYSPHPVKRPLIPKGEDEEVVAAVKRVRFSVDPDSEDLSYGDCIDNASDHDAHFSDDDDESTKHEQMLPEETNNEISKNDENVSKTENSKSVEEKSIGCNNAFDIINQILTESEKCKQAILDRTIHNKDADKTIKTVTVNNENAKSAVPKESVPKTVTQLSEEPQNNSSAAAKPTSVLSPSDNSSLQKALNKTSSDTNKINSDTSKISSDTCKINSDISKTNISKSDVSKSKSAHKMHSKNSRSSSSHVSKNCESKHHHSSKETSKASNSVSKDKQSRSSSHDRHSHSSSHEKHSHTSSREKHSHSSSHSKHSSHDKSSHKSSSLSQKNKSSKSDSHKSKSTNSHDSKSGSKHEPSKDKSISSSTESKNVNKDNKRKSSSSSHKHEKARRTSSSSDRSTHKNIDSNSDKIVKYDKTKQRHQNETIRSSTKVAIKVSSSSHHIRDKHKKHSRKRATSSDTDDDSDSSVSDVSVSSGSSLESNVSVQDKKKRVKTSNSKKHESKHRHENKVVKSPTKHSHQPKVEHSKKRKKQELASDDDDNHDSYSSDSAERNSEVALPDIDVDTDLDEHDTYEECLRIFNEYMPTNDEENVKSKHSKASDRSIKEEQVQAKQRVAHSASSSDSMTISRRVKSSQVPTKISASQAMYCRYNKIQKMLDEQTQAVAASKPSAFLNSMPSTVPTKRRIAHVPNVSAIITATDTVKAIATKATELGGSDVTIAQTNAKGVNRIAHIPKQLTMARPTIPAEYGSKVPCNIRQRYLNIIIDECLKIYEEERDAVDRALSEEKNAYQRSSNRSVYINVVVNNIKRIRSEVSGEVPVTPVIREEEPTTSTEVTSPISPVWKSPPQVKSPTKPNPRTVSHQAVLGGRKAANVSYSIQRHKSAKPSGEIAGHVLYRLLSPYLLTEQQLIENCYPQAHPTNHGEAVIPNFDLRKSVSSSGLDRTCRRCGAHYQVSSKGVYLTEEECVYHYGRSFKRRVSGTIEHRYTCCEGDLTSEGCCCAPVHVCENVDMDCLTGYVATLPKTPPINGDYGVYALDCEMCYTLKGLELTRLTVIGSNMKPVYETLVKPENRILDYNTKFSGITEEDMYGVRTTLRDVQAVLLSKFSSKTILIGHSLESDFKALKLIHGTVIDTSVVFPHRLGPPKKRALKTLMAEYLNKIIQNSVDGHDSQEDAISCMELMMWKVKEDLKKLIR